MASKLRAGRRVWESEPVSLVDVGDVGDVGNVSERDPDLEAEVTAVAAWFDALPAELRAYLDGEARRGQEAYVWP